MMKERKDRSSRVAIKSHKVLTAAIELDEELKEAAKLLREWMKMPGLHSLPDNRRKLQRRFTQIQNWLDRNNL